MTGDCLESSGSNAIPAGRIGDQLPHLLDPVANSTPPAETIEMPPAPNHGQPAENEPVDDDGARLDAARGGRNRMVPPEVKSEIS